MPLASHCSTTGVTVSGVEATIIMSTLAVVDEVAGHLSGAVGVGLAVLHFDGDRVLLAVARHDAVADVFLPLVHAVLVRQTEVGQATGERGDEADLDLVAHLGAVDTDVVVSAAPVVSVEAAPVVRGGGRRGGGGRLRCRRRRRARRRGRAATPTAGTGDARDLEEVAAADGLLRSSLRTFLGTSLSRLAQPCRLRGQGIAPSDGY